MEEHLAQLKNLVVARLAITHAQKETAKQFVAACKELDMTPAEVLQLCRSRELDMEDGLRHVAEALYGPGGYETALRVIYPKG